MRMRSCRLGVMCILDLILGCVYSCLVMHWMEEGEMYNS